MHVKLIENKTYYFYYSFQFHYILRFEVLQLEFLPNVFVAFTFGKILQGIENSKYFCNTDFEDIRTASGTYHS